MSKYFVLVLAVVMLVLPGCIATSASAHSLEYSAEIALQSSIRIEMDQGPLGWQTVGSAVAVRKHSPFYVGKEPKFAIVTAKHVARAEELGYDLRACAVLEPSECVDVGKFISNQHDTLGNDWAVFPVDKLPDGSKPAMIRNSDGPAMAEQLLIVGHPWGDFMVSEGILGAYRIDEVGDTYYVVQGFVAPGNSGGGVYDLDGKLVGLVSAMPVKADPVTGIPSAQEDIAFVVPIRVTGL